MNDYPSLFCKSGIKYVIMSTLYKIDNKWSKKREKKQIGHKTGEQITNMI